MRSRGGVDAESGDRSDTASVAGALMGASLRTSATAPALPELATAGVAEPGQVLPHKLFVLADNFVLLHCHSLHRLISVRHKGR